MELKTLVVVNPSAREGEVGRQWPNLEREVMGALTPESGAADEVRVVQTGAEDRGVPQIREALRAGFNRVIVVGGDGTLSDAVQGFFENGKPVAPEAALGVVPCGRGDDFFKTILARKGRRFVQGVGSSVWKQGLEVIREGSARPLDVARIQWNGDPGGSGAGSSRYWLNVLSFGFPGLVVQKVKDRERFFGIPIHGSFLAKTGATYVAQSLAALAEYRPLEMSVQVDGEMLFEGPAFGAFVLNGAYNAGGVCWSNLARVDDGLLEVLVLEPRGLMGFARDLPQMATGQWRGVAGAHLARGRRVELSLSPRERKRHALFDVDGDLPEPEDARGAVIEVVPGALQLWS